MQCLCNSYALPGFLPLLPHVRSALAYTHEAKSTAKLQHFCDISKFFYKFCQKIVLFFHFYLRMS